MRCTGKAATVEGAERTEEADRTGRAYCPPPQLTEHIRPLPWRETKYEPEHHRVRCLYRAERQLVPEFVASA